MSTPNGKPSDFFLRIPKCEVDGTNWSVYKSRFSFAADAAGLADHLLETHIAPIAPTISSPPTATDTVALEAYDKELKAFKSGQAIVKQAIASTIPDGLFLRVKDEKTAAILWKKVAEEFEKKSKMVTVDLRRRLQDERCTDTGNVRTHLEKLQTLRTDLIGMGADPGDENFTAIILGSLPPSYDPYLSAITATSTILGKTLSPDDLIRGLNEEADRRSLKNKSKKDDRDIAFSAGERKGGHKKGSAKSNIECYNCHKKGHVKADCWAKGGGKEGTGPRQKGKGKAKEAANTATDKDDDGVWMAQVQTNLQLFKEEWGSLVEGNSDTPHSSASTAGCWLSDYDDEDFFEAEEDGSVNVGLIATMDSTGTDSDSMPDLQSVSDSDSECDSMPDLQSVSDSSEEEEEEYNSRGEISRTASPDGLDHPLQHLTDFIDSVEVSVNKWLSNQEDIEEENITSSFDTAMLANEAGTPGVETELYDSGASRHMSPYRYKFLNYISIPPKSITAADNGTFQAIGQGDIRISIPNGKSTATILLKGVLYAPKLGLTLVSISKITDAGFATLFRDEYCRIFDKQRKILGVVNKKNGTYRVQHGPTMPTGVTAAATVETITIDQLHRRMGHIAPDTAKRLVEDGIVTGIKLDTSTEIKSCASCKHGRMHRKPVAKARKEERAAAMGDIIHSDVWGPSPMKTINGREYYSSFTDDHTRWSRLYIQRTKDETFDSYQAYEAWLLTQFNVNIKKLHSDRGGEYWSNEFDAHLAKMGTERSFTVHDTPEHNGVAERLNRTVLERVRAMLHASGMPRFLWGEAVNHAIYLKNRTSTRALDNKTPFEMVYGKKPDLSRLPEFGAKVWVHDPDGSKLDGRAQEGHWVGFDEVSSGHRIYIQGKRTIAVERSVTLDRDDNLVPIPGDLLFEGEQEENNQSSPENLNPNTHQPAVPPIPAAPTTPKQSPPHTPPRNPPESMPLPASPSIAQLRKKLAQTDPLGPDFEEPEEEPTGRGQHVRKPSAYIQALQSGAGQTSNRPSDPQVPRGIRVPKTGEEDPVDTAAHAETSEDWEMVDILEHAMATATSDSEALEPTFEEAKKRPDWAHWKVAIDAEITALKAAGTWSLVERPDGRNIVDCKWVLRIKKNAAGEIDKYKARLVARGFTQVHGVDYYETFSPTAKLASIRLILAIAARNDWEIDMFDFHSAFLNGELDPDELIYMEQPPDHEFADRRKYVLKLNKALYGLKQGGRKWYETLSRSLAEIGFTQCASDHAVFYTRSDGHLIIMAVHVDDCTITGSCPKLLEDYKTRIGALFKMTDLGPVSWLLGIEIKRNREERTISLSQQSYISSILQRFNFADAKPLAMPMDPNVQLSKEQCPVSVKEIAAMKHVPYREAVGSLMWAAIGTRPDIAYSVGTLSKFLDNPGSTHWDAAKRVFRYLLGTKDWRLTYGIGKKGLEGFSDADGMSEEYRRAISGYAFILDGGAISWSSKKQELVTLSTTEAEYVAMTYAAKEAAWLRQLISELFRPLEYPITLHGDNQSAIALAHSDIGQFHARTKHIDIRYHFIRYVIANGTIRLVYCPTNDMVADTLTKALPSAKAKHFASALGLRSV